MASQIIELLFSGVSQTAQEIGSALNELVTGLFVSVTSGTNGDTYTLTTFGTVALVFMGISLAIGLSRFVLNWVTSLGN